MSELSIVSGVGESIRPLAHIPLDLQNWRENFGDGRDNDRSLVG